MVIMIVVLHNAVPHHHYGDILIHRHECKPGCDNLHSGHDHHPTKCYVHAIDLYIPRTFSLSEVLVLTDGSILTGFPEPATFTVFSDNTVSYIPVLEEAILSTGNHSSIPSRGPPC